MGPLPREFRAGARRTGKRLPAGPLQPFAAGTRELSLDFRGRGRKDRPAAGKATRESVGNVNILRRLAATAIKSLVLVRISRPIVFTGFSFKK